MELLLTAGKPPTIKTRVVKGAGERHASSETRVINRSDRLLDRGFTSLLEVPIILLRAASRFKNRPIIIDPAARQRKSDKPLR